VRYRSQEGRIHPAGVSNDHGSGPTEEIGEIRVLDGHWLHGLIFAGSEIPRPPFDLAQRRSLAELTEEPILVVAALLLIGVSIAWIVMARVITREMRRQALRRIRPRAPGKKPPKPPKPKDYWSSPP
jgi:hypothetical protein